jgi:hypothetical protein
MTWIVRGYRRPLAWTLLALASFAACTSDTPAAAKSEPDVFAMRLSVGGQQLVVDAAGGVSGTGVLRTGVSAAVSAVFTDRSGVPVSSVTSGAFRLDGVVVGDADVNYTPDADNTLHGTLIALAPLGSIRMRFSLYNMATQRTTWGPFEVTFTASY